MASLFTESGQIANLNCFSMIYPINPAKMQGERNNGSYSRAIKMLTGLENELLVVQIWNTFDIDIQVIRT